MIFIQKNRNYVEPMGSTINCLLSANMCTLHFDYVITAEDVGAYKPNVKVFEYAFERFGNKNRVLHVAQSIFHDIEPANQLDLDAVWIDRTEGRLGATKETSFTPKWQFSSLKDFCESFLV